MCFDKFVDFLLNIVLQEFLDNEPLGTGNAVQNLIKVNTMQALRFWLNWGIQFELDALFWPMLYIYYVL